MKQKKDPQLAKVRELASLIGVMIEDFSYHFDKEKDAYIVRFTMLNIVDKTQGPEVETFELTLDQAYWYLVGAANGSLWTMMINGMAEKNARMH